MDSPEKQTDKESAEAAKKDGSMLRRWLIVVLVGVAAGAGGFAVVSVPAPARDAQEEMPAARPTPRLADSATSVIEPVIFEPESIIVNLANTQARRYLKATLALELRNRQVQVVLENKLKRVQLLDLLNSCLSSKSIEDLDGEEKRNDLRREIRDEANLKLGLDDGIVRVYFTEFVIQ